MSFDSMLPTVGAVALVLAAAVAPVGPAAAAGHAPSRATTVDVAASDVGFRLSRTRVPVGVVAFRVRNVGRRRHDFEIAGARTPLLEPGHRATLRLRFRVPGRRVYVSSVSGRVEGGLKGVLVVTAAPRRPGRVERVSTVAVLEFEFGFRLSSTTVPAGRVTFVMRNAGALLHNFHLVGFGAAAFLGPGQTARMTLELAPGTYTYLCDVRNHASQGMQGTLVVT